MTEEIQKPTAVAVDQAANPSQAANPPIEASGSASKKRFIRGNKPQRGGGRGGRDNRRGPRADVPAESDYEEKNIEVARVTRVTKGGKRMRFRVLSVIGNHKGRCGYGLAKGVDVAAATSKATTKARKSLITVPMSHETIPHPIHAKFSAAKVILKPAPKGTGVKAGGAIRIVLELAGVPNVTAKILGSQSKINNVKAVFKALKMLATSNKQEKPTEGAEAQVKPTAV